MPVPAANRPDADRNPADAYCTPLEVARGLLSLIPIPVGSVVIEPHVGAGAFARAARERGAVVIGCDINPDAPGFEFCHFSVAGDLLAADTMGQVHEMATGQANGALVVGNPPFKGIADHIAACHMLAPVVNLLCPLTLMESQRRVSMWRDYPAAEAWPLAKRVQFEHLDGASLVNGNSTALAWFRWVRGHNGPIAVHPCTELEVSNA